MKKLLAMALCLVAVSGYAQKGKEKIAADFYGVDYSCVDVKGADEEPGAFIKAFEAINRLFLSEPKKYDVAGFTGIDILSTGVEQANESLGALAAEQFTPRSAATDWQTQLPQIVARYDNGSGNKGLVLVLVFGEILPKSFAKDHAERVSMAMGGPLYIVKTLLAPLVWVFVQIKRLFTGRRSSELNVQPSVDRKSTRLNSSHDRQPRMPSSA